MISGKRFKDEYPTFGSLFEKLYQKRELDDWYTKACKKKLNLPKELMSIKEIKNIKIHDNFSPSTHIFIDLLDKIGEGGFVLKQQINLTVSKIIPVYKKDFLYFVKHNSLVGEIGTLGSPQETFESLLVDEEIRKIFKSHNFIELSEYDLYDTIYDWSELNLDPFGRSLTLDYGVFYDALELCDD